MQNTESRTLKCKEYESTGWKLATTTTSQRRLFVNDSKSKTVKHTFESRKSSTSLLSLQGSEDQMRRAVAIVLWMQEIRPWFDLFIKGRRPWSRA
jgi:hypothetical protein